MTLLHLLAYAGGLAGFLFVTLSLASGLLWLAELIEEHSRHAKVVGMRAIYAIVALHAILYFTDSLPFLPTLFSIVCHLVYLQNFSSSWPYISLTSPRFILSCILVVADHFIWFFHFAAVAQEAKKYRTPKYRYGGQARAGNGDGPAFGDVAAFFAICIWFVPLFLFLSLSANDNALPSFDPTSSAPPSPGGNTVNLSSPGPGGIRPTSLAPSRKSLIRTALDPVLSFLPRLRSSSRRKNEEGLIAPRTPIRGSPLHSPVHMPQSYFPWGSDEPSAATSSLTSSSTPTHGQKLSADRARTPPPPRRVQSEIQVTKGSGNPRGIATRNGTPAFPVEGETEIVEAPRRQAPIRPTTPSMSLGPRGGVEQELTKRKAD
ncbi:hypothetical protein IAR55_006578 [Kwoniella newhampshirensis]|uniref:Endoplasmic reticulum protein n=1 Tax=Kwoniella newhampshirensis TaxID=1651941 RepID=A0AAW0YUF9_9TREE